MNKIKKNDNVYILSGKDRGKSGRVFRVYPAEGKALVEGINYVKKHSRKSQANPQGGIVQKENPIHISKLAVFCKTCKRPARIGISILADGTKSRFCKRCREVM